MTSKIIHMTALILIGICSSGIVSYTQNENTSSSAEYYRNGIFFKERNQIDLAITAFENATKRDSHFAEAFHQLSLLYMQLGTVDARAKATRAMKRALRLDSKNILYNLDMAKLSLKKEMNGDATSYLKKVLEIDPGNAEANYRLGLLQIDDMLWYKDLINPQQDIVFTFNDYADKIMHTARLYFLNALSNDPSFVLPYYQLAFIEFEFSHYDAMIKLLKKGIQNHPKDKNLSLFLGLAYQRKSMFPLAQKYFEQAKRLMTQKELRELQSVSQVLSPSTMKKYAALDEAEKSKFTDTFWRQRDPLFLTKFNERVLEHYSRLAYVNLRFSDFEKGTEGWETDQGKTYIRFGPPKKMYRTRPSIDVTFGNATIDNDKKYLNTSKETWVYDNFNLTFEDEFLNRKFRFKKDFNPDRDSKRKFEQLVKKEPEHYKPHMRGDKFDFPYSITQFRDASGATKIELFYGVPPNKVSLYQYEDDADIRVKLKTGFFVFDDRWQELNRTVKYRNKSLISIQNPKHDYFKIDRFQTTMTQGMFNFAFEIMDEFTGNYGHIKDTLAVRAFDTDHLNMSDLLLAANIEPDSSVSIYDFENLKIIPNLFGRFSAHEPLFVYFEIYNLRKIADGESHCNVEIILSPVQNQTSSLAKFASGVGSIFGFTAAKQGKVSITNEYYGESDTQHIYNAFQLTRARPGDYKLIVRVTDVNSGATVEKETTLNIY